MARPRSRRVWIHLSVATLTVLATPAALIWWKSSILFVILLSLATQLYTALSAAEGADDKALMERLDRLEDLLRDRSRS